MRPFIEEDYENNNEYEELQDCIKIDEVILGFNSFNSKDANQDSGIKEQLRGQNNAIRPHFRVG